MEKSVYIMDEVRKAVAATSKKLAPTLGKQIQYMFGHPQEILQTLQEMTKSQVQANNKYPLVGLFTDIPIVSNLDGFYGRATFTMIIATLTKNDYKAAQRLENNFRPLLQPIKAELLHQISRLGQFTTPGEINYTEIEHYYWGRQGLYGNAGNVFSDFIDCIELRNIQVNINPQFCTTLKTNI